VFSAWLHSNDSGADHRKHRFQHFVSGCLLIHCCGNPFVLIVIQ
jgi:hypothetical protein